MLKIDVQGAELQVLHGATGLLSQVDSALVECSFVELYGGQAPAGDIVAFLYDHGFSLDALCSPTASRAGRVVQADLLSERASPRST